MKHVKHCSLPRRRRATIISAPVASIVLALLCADALAQEKAEPKRDELDVTMQIITDPDAKLPDEVVRRITLPAPKPASTPASTSDGQRPADSATKGQERAKEAQELGRENAERGKERGKDAADKREQAERSQADERRRNPPKDPPGRPSTPPGR